MAVDSDRKFGQTMLAVLVAAFAYYTVWVVIVPFVDRDHHVQKYFPPREYAVLAVMSFGLIVLITCVAFIGLLLVNQSKASSQRLRWQQQQMRRQQRLHDQLLRQQQQQQLQAASAAATAATIAAAVAHKVDEDVEEQGQPHTPSPQVAWQQQLAAATAAAASAAAASAAHAPGENLSDNEDDTFDDYDDDDEEDEDDYFDDEDDDVSYAEQDDEDRDAEFGDQPSLAEDDTVPMLTPSHVMADPDHFATTVS